MAQKRDSDVQQNTKGKRGKEQIQDIKNAEYIAKNKQPNHPNT
ncbi:hypothetical protein [Pelosinus propionicus]|uniref:Uncharacterized protein n=1 Tax=Pelosinus propionicus DSM 13327 TaxID=1123291 RepID=A0A1I4LQA0_9FIRM|nr:hypothetical protein [Pelosinus propionicus]SFL93119.1 hypothetical protein SAMN04490355_102629 [Pelosinus propionicus DSM 13327]